jgi:hypothetical protein
MALIPVELHLQPIPGLADVGYKQSSIEDTNDLVDLELPYFGSGSTDADMAFECVVPDTWDGTTAPSVSIVSHFNATSGKYRLQLLYVVIAPDAVSMDPSAFDRTVDVTSATGDTVPGTAHIGDEASANLTLGDFTKKYVVKGVLRRKLSDTTNDTVGVDQLIDSAVMYFTSA